MPNNWKTYKLSDIGEIIGGGTPSTSKQEYYNGDIPWITPKDLSNHSSIFISKGERSITELGLKNSSAKLMPEGTVLLTSRAPIGYLAISENQVCTNQGFKSIVVNQNLVNNKFIYYLLKSNIDLLLQNASGSTFQEISGSVVKNLEFDFPPLQEQKSIASILSAIDDKIENNLAINKTLEEMAMALYKHWFVDFGPFQEGEFVESELGRIPKGWEVKQLEELVDVGSSKRIFYNEYVEAGIPFYRGKEVIELSKGKSISSELFITIEKFQEIKSKFEVPKKGDILISSVGTIGVSWLVDGFEDFYFKDGNLTWLKNYKTFLKGEYLHLWLNSENGKNQIDGEVIGSTQKALTISSLRNFKILFPSENVYKKIGDEFVNYYEQRQLNLIEIKTLTQLRDTLLPKLISGEVRLKEFQES